MSLTKSVLLVSNKVMHYRIPIYNHLRNRLSELGGELAVLTNDVQSDCPYTPEFKLEVEKFSFFSYKKKIHESEPDVVIFFMHIRDFVVWPLLFWLRLRQIKIIYWNHGVNLKAPNNRFKKLIFRLFHSNSDAILLYSENERKYIAKRHQHKTFVANNTLNFNEFPSVPETKNCIRKELGVDFDRVVLFVGRVTPEKRLDDLLSASEFLEEGYGVVIVGGGLSENQKQKIQKSPKLLYLGEIYENVSINRIFRMSDIFSIPGKIGLGLNQAFYWGLPVVTENVRHSPEIVYLRQGRNGFVVPVGDVAELANKMNYLMSSTSVYESFSASAKSEILTNGNIDKMCDGFLKAIEYV